MYDRYIEDTKKEPPTFGYRSKHCHKVTPFTDQRGGCSNASPPYYNEIAEKYYFNKTIETIEAFTILLWEERVEVERLEPGQAERLQQGDVILVVTSASAKNGRVGGGGAIQDSRQVRLEDESTAAHYQLCC